MKLYKSKFLVISLSLVGILSFSKLKINDIQITNLKNLDKDYVQKLLPVKVGDDYSNIELSNIYKSVKNSPAINDLIITPTQDGDNVNIKLSVDEKPNASDIVKREEAIKEAQQKTDLIINTITVKGLKNVNKSIVDKVIDDGTVKKGDYLIPYNVELLRNKIYSLGYFKNVESTIIRNAKDKTVDIVFNVVENPIVKSISISGSSTFLEQELIDASKIKVGEVLNNNYINPDTMPLIDFYKSKGILSARLKNISMSDNGNLSIELSEGTVGSIKIIKDYQRKDDERRNSDKARLKTKPFIFNRVMAIKKGEPLKKQDIDETLRELYKTGLFTSIVPNIIPNNNLLDVEFLVNERSTTSIQANLSFTTTTKLTGSLKLSDSNFLGRGQNLSLGLEYSINGNYNISFSFFDPWIEGTDKIQAGGSLSFAKTQQSYGQKDMDFAKKRDLIDKETDSKAKADMINEFLNKPYTQYSYTISGTIGKEIYKEVFATLKPTIKGISSINYEGKPLADYTTLSLAPSLIYDTRDNSFMPKNGAYIQLTDELGYIFRDDSLKYEVNVSDPDIYKATTSMVNPTGLYNKIEGDFRYYHPLYTNKKGVIKNSMAYRLSLGYSTPLSKDKFSTVDGSTFRGFDDILSEREKIVLNIENRTYISDNVQGVLFIDLGNIYNPDDITKALSFSEIKKSFGIGMRVNTPLGVIRLDYGWPIIRNDYINEYSIGRGKISFGFGQTF